VTSYTIRVGSVEFACRSDQSVLVAMERLGKNVIAVGCRGGGCGACKVRVLSGEYTCGRMSRAHVSEQEQAQGYALSCKLYPLSDLAVECVRQPFHM
jgi:ferredoxin